MPIQIVGFDDVFKELDDMNISDNKKRKALKTGMDIVKKEIEDNSPVRSGRMKRGWKGTIKKFDGDLGFEIRGNTVEDIENEFGSARNKKHIGFFSRAVDSSANRAVEAIISGVLD